jgi:hypothetical protein
MPPNDLRRLCWCSPDDAVIDYLLDVGVIISWIAFVPGSEIEHFAATAVVTAATAEYLAPLEPANENQVFWRGDVKMLPVHFLMF